MTRSAGEVGALTGSPRCSRAFPLVGRGLRLILPLRERAGPEHRCHPERRDDHRAATARDATTGETPWACSTGCATGADDAPAGHATTAGGAPSTAVPSVST